MVEQHGDRFLIDALADGEGDGEVHRSVQDLWRAQNAAWRARVLGQLRQSAPVEAAATA
jgi:hypothetical protein